MLKIISLLLLIGSATAANRKPTSGLPTETLNRLKSLYPDQSEEFILTRVAQATTPFLKWRAFPGYYYELLGRSQDILGSDFQVPKGMCAGDAHLENFGFLYEGRPVFTLNDLDDASSCSLNSDALRLFVGHRLLSPLSAKEWLAEYRAGLQGSDGPLPTFLKTLEEESASKKAELPKKYQKIFSAKVCEGDFSPVLPDELAVLKTFTQNLLFACSRTKDTGGSAGNKRFIIFYPEGETTRALELKPLTHPSPLFNSQLSLQERKSLYEKAVGVFFGRAFSSSYFPVELGQKLYLRRPLLAGNVDVKGDDMSSQDLKEVGLYQARTLGKYHRSTLPDHSAIADEQWEKIATGIEKKWRAEFVE